MTPGILETERLVLRQWRESDRVPFAALNGDAETMRFFPSTLNRLESDVMIDRMIEMIASRGWGIFAMERKSDGAFVGMTGLNRPRFEAHFTPCLEIGWRSLKPYWGHGYTTEAAAACLDFAFEAICEPVVYAFTVPDNQRSRRVMERLGMHHLEEGDFDHPLIPQGAPTCRHVLYALRRADWRRAPSGQT